MVDFPKDWKATWKHWNIRVFVLTSLLIQIFLILFSSKRKKKASKRFVLFIWSLYLLADWVAAFALGLLCNSQNDNDCPSPSPSPSPSSIHTHNKPKPINMDYNQTLLAFWAPFLLLHLGGPDTITAFAMEDNELWPRHLLGLLFEVLAALYVFVLSIPKNKLLVPTLLMFVAGFIKYGERTFALYRASLDGFRDSMLKDPDPGPNYAKLMEEYASFKNSEIPTRIIVSKEAKERADAEAANKEEMILEDTTDVDRVREAHKFFNKFKGLMVELIFSFHERDESRATFFKRSAQDAFRVVEFELSFIYDVLFTKAVIVHLPFGYILRAVCSCSIIGACLGFFLTKKHEFVKLDIAITYTLLGGALCLDALALLMFMISDWTIVNLKKIRFLDSRIYTLLAKLPQINRWSVQITQHNLITFCLPKHPTYFRRIVGRQTVWGKFDELLYFRRNLRRIGIFTNTLDEVQYTWREYVNEDLKEFIFMQLKKKAEITEDSKESRRLCSCRGDWALEQRGYLRKFGYSVEVEFDESLLMWHIATDLCYYTTTDDDDRGPAMISISASLHRQFCKLISDYLANLLVFRPAMMSSAAVIGQIRYRDTCEEAKNFFLRRPLEDSKSKPISALWISKETHKKELDEMLSKGCSNLLSVNTENKPADVKGDRSKSVLFDACILAKELKGLEEGKRWEIMSEVWVEMLAYAASICPGIAHAQRLSKGGELVTFVWFLMTHLGLGDQYRIEAGHARAKLIVQE